MDTEIKISKNNFRFISRSLFLLSLPIVLSVAGLYMGATLIHRASLEDKISGINHILTMLAQEIVSQAEKVVITEVVTHDAIMRSDNTGSYYDYKEQINSIGMKWKSEFKYNSVLDFVFISKERNPSIAKNESNEQLNMTLNKEPSVYDNEPMPRRLYSTEPKISLYWTMPTIENSSGRYKMTLFHRVSDKSSNTPVFNIGVKIDLTAWSEAISAKISTGNSMRHMLVNRDDGMVLMHNDVARIGEDIHKLNRWKEITGESGFFYSSSTEEVVAYEILPEHPGWISITIQKTRDNVGYLITIVSLAILSLSASIFIIFASFFKMRLSVLISSLLQMVRVLRFNSDKKQLSHLILPDIPEIAQLHSELGFVADEFLQNYQDIRRDSLTGLYNRRYMDERMMELQKKGAPFVFALIDLDHFKSINDRFGHVIGDKVLRRVAALGQDLLGNSGSVYRYGGEELAVIFEQISLEDAKWQVERWRMGVSELKWREENLIVTFSCGIGVSLGRSAEELLIAVDQMLYRAKQDGRDRLCSVEMDGKERMGDW